MNNFYKCSIASLIFILFSGILLNPVSATAFYDDLIVIDFLICEDVVEREPVNVLQSYSMSDERAWSFARISNNGEMRSVKFVWFYEDEKYFELESRIGTSPNWRTYSSVTLQPGVWSVELHDDKGNKLAEVRFHVAE